MSSKLSANFQGALWIVASCLGATIMSLGLKSLAGEIHSTQIVLIRCLIGLLVVIPLLAQEGFAKIKSKQIKLHLIRGVCAAVAINLGFFSLTILPLATATVLFFAAPLFVTLFAIPLLNEKVGWRRMLATLLGFIGTIIVINPSVSGFDVKLLIPVCSSVFFAISLILNKQLSRSDSPAVLMFYIFIIVSVLSAPMAISNWITPNFGQWQILVLVVSLFATSRTYFDIKAYSIGEASFVAPFQYLRILFIGIAAYLVFQEVIEKNVLAGALVIISSTFYIAQREYRLKKKIDRITQP